MDLLGSTFAEEKAQPVVTRRRNARQTDVIRPVVVPLPLARSRLDFAILRPPLESPTSARRAVHAQPPDRCIVHRNHSHTVDTAATLMISQLGQRVASRGS